MSKSRLSSLVAFMVLALGVRTVTADLIISEIMHNSNGGGTWDWVELFNTGDTSINLDNLSLLQESAIFGPGVYNGFELAGDLAPHSYGVVYYSIGLPFPRTESDFIAEWPTASTTHLISHSIAEGFNGVDDITLFDSSGSGSILWTFAFPSGLVAPDGTSIFLQDLADTTWNDGSGGWTASTVGGLQPSVPYGTWGNHDPGQWPAYSSTVNGDVGIPGVPEPGTMGLGLLALGGAAAARFRKKKTA